MPQGSKEKYTSKQKRQARHIEESAEKSGKSPKRAAQIAWATVNKETGGAGKKVSDTSPSKRGGKKGGKKAGKKKASKKTTKKAAKKSATRKSVSRKTASKKTTRKKTTKKSTRKKSGGRKTARKSSK